MTPRTRDRRVRWWTLSAGIAAAGLTMAMCCMLLNQSVVGYQLDLSVFRDAGAAFGNGAPLYSEDFPTTSGFRFIYPPFAAVVFAPMAWLPAHALQVVWAALNIVLVWWILRVCLHRLDVGRPGRLAMLALGPALLLEPVRANFAFGQANIVLMALVAADCLRTVPRWLRGTAIGLAAAIKLTPAGFALVLLARGDRTAVLRAAAVFGATVAVGAWLLPRDSAWFWVTEFFRDDRAGNHAFSRNQAITGPIARMGIEGTLKYGLWLSAVAVVVVGAFWAARRFARNGEHVVSFGVVALAVLLAAPFAVNHHWVYCVLLVPLLLAERYRRWRPVLSAAFVAFLIAPHYLLDQVGASPPWQAVLMHVAGNAQFLAAVVLLASAVWVARNRHASSAVDSHSRESAVDGVR